MKYTDRPIHHDDLDVCLSITHDPFMYGAERLRDLRELWLDIITRDIGHARVIVDEEKRVVAFGVQVFVSNEHADRYWACLKPFIGSQILEAWCGGKTSFLNESGIARANGHQGVNLVTIHSGFREQTAECRAALEMAWVKCVVGLNVRSIIAEIIGPVEALNAVARELGFGMRPYPEELLANSPLPKGLCVRVIGGYAERLRDDSYNFAINNVLFNFRPPRFGFTTHQRQVLQLATLNGYTDQQIAALLGSSSGGVKKHWQNVYDRFRDVDMQAIPELELIVHDAGRRGAECRRHVIAYLRDHPEELHPYDASSK
jgi:hypothetical protein